MQGCFTACARVLSSVSESAFDELNLKNNMCISLKFTCVMVGTDCEDWGLAVRCGSDWFSDQINITILCLKLSSIFVGLDHTISPSAINHMVSECHFWSVTVTVTVHQYLTFSLPNCNQVMETLRDFNAYLNYVNINCLVELKVEMVKVCCVYFLSTSVSFRN